MGETMLVEAILEPIPPFFLFIGTMIGFFITICAIAIVKYLVLAAEEQKRHNQVMERLFTEIRDRLP